MIRFGANTRRQVSVVDVGRDRRPLLCIDEFMADAQVLVELAAQADFIDAGPVYPGIRAPAPAGYVRMLLETIAADVQSALGAVPRAELELCAFSMVTTPVTRLRPIQRLPHFDGPEPHRFAFIHYLCEPSQGGTSFYRHHASGLEAVNPENVDRYRTLVARELEQAAACRDYASAQTAGFERIHAVAAAFNRLILYPGNALHSGDIGREAVLIEDPRRGRLTINGFGHWRRP